MTVRYIRSALRCQTRIRNFKMSPSSVPILGVQKLRQLIDSPNTCVQAAGVYDGISARLALNVGFDALYMVRDLTGFLSAMLNGRRALEHQCQSWDSQIWGWQR